jgi:hypothetical protein
VSRLREIEAVVQGLVFSLRTALSLQVLAALMEAVESDGQGRHFTTQASVTVMLSCLRMLSRVSVRRAPRAFAVVR